MGELKPGDRVVATATPNEGVGVVDEVGTMRSFIPESLQDGLRDGPIARVRWSDDSTNLLWIDDLTILPRSLESDVVEEWLRG